MKNKIKNHFDKKLFSRITRRISKTKTLLNRGYIVSYSDKFIILQETDDFRLLGYHIIKSSAIEKIRYNKNDKFHDKIMELEGIKNGVFLKQKINLKSWFEIFESLNDIGNNVIVECEKDGLFTIGKITDIRKKSVFIRYFNACGVYDKKPTKLKFKNITKVIFDDRYIEVFSRHLSEPKK